MEGLRRLHYRRGGGSRLGDDRIGWMALKKLVVARGVPRADVNAVTSKAALRELAEAHGAPLRFVVGR